MINDKFGAKSTSTYLGQGGCDSGCMGLCVCVVFVDDSVVAVQQLTSSESGRLEHDDRPEDGGVRTVTLCN